MKIRITILFLFFAIFSFAQRTMFQKNNFSLSAPLPYQAPSIVTNGLLLNLDAANPTSYTGSGNSWNDLVGSNNGTLANVTFEVVQNLLFLMAVLLESVFQMGFFLGTILLLRLGFIELAVVG